MKFIVSSAELLKRLSNINGVITTNPVVPILENFLFEINDGLLTVTASDLQTSMITEIDVEAKENGSRRKQSRARMLYGKLAPPNPSLPALPVEPGL